MSYIRSRLEPGERIVALASLSLWTIAPSFVAGAALLALALGALGADAVLGSTVSLTAATALALLGALALIHGLTVFYTSEQGVTDRRVLLKRGAIRRRASALELRKVELVELEQSIAGRLLGFGTVFVRGAGALDLVVQGIAEPTRFQALVDRAKDQLVTSVADRPEQRDRGPRTMSADPGDRSPNR